MKKLFFILLAFITLLLLTSCGEPTHYYKKPNYGIQKPKIIYPPSKRSLGKMVKKLQGSPYVWAEEGPNNFDCSGYTYYMYGSMGIDIPRVSRHQAKNGKRVEVKDLQYGDLIFFATNKKNLKKITHVGMYLGGGWFTHASTSKHEVIYTNLFTSEYYQKRLRVCRRYLTDANIKVAVKKPWRTKEVIQKPLVRKARVRKSITRRAYQARAANKAIVIKSSIQSIEQRSATGKYYVQVGSFTGIPKEELLYTITSKGFQYTLIQYPRNGKSISKLLIGPYATRDLAVATLAKVREHVQKDAFIAQIR